MPEVISNTSPLQYLHQAGCLDLLPMLYGSVIVPEGVVRELSVGRELGHDLPRVKDLPWVRIRKPPFERLLSIAADLGQGEREAIALAVEIENSLAILDDGLARRYARALGIQFTGTLGVLLRAKEAGHLTKIGPTVERLEELGFRLDPGTRRSVLELAGESPTP